MNKAGMQQTLREKTKDAAPRSLASQPGRVSLSFRAASCKTSLLSFF